jgi:hypothetical protein
MGSSFNGGGGAGGMPTAAPQSSWGDKLKTGLGNITPQMTQGIAQGKTKGKLKEISLLTPQQQSFVNSALNMGGPQALQGLLSMLGPVNQDTLNSIFEKGYLNPAMSAFNNNILPGIQQRFADMDAGSSSALNRTLANAASNLSTNLGSAYGGLYNNALDRQQNALNSFGNLVMGQQFQPYIHQKSGFDWSSLIGPAVGLGMAFL